jgi:hypothetical protein
MENNEKLQAIQRLKEAKNILVTVSDSPSIDQLAAALGFTLIMNKLDKRATTVFSGQIPSVLDFLKPAETIEENTDSLRDFIIALDKSKADKLKYKVEDDVVKVFITPYKTSLSEQDFSFSQGDFNVDVVVALGVDSREHLDKAVMAHGRILHDATVIGITNDNIPIDIGSINWQEPAASSLCEMLAGISNEFKKNLLDGQIATAYLTGIVAETDRFSNEKTTPVVMSLSSTLMAAGANQQLISNELSTPPEPEEVPDELPAPDTGADQDVVADDGTLTVSHVADDAIHIDDVGNLKTAEELNRAVTEVQENAQTEPEIPQESEISPQEDEEINAEQDSQEPVQQQSQEYNNQSEADQNNEVANNVPENSGKFSKYVGYKEPENPINANIVSPDEVPLFDPMAEIPASSPVDNLVNSQSEQTSAQQDNVEPVTRSYKAETVQPLGPAVEANQTIDNIEKQVLSYEESANAEVPSPPTPVDGDAEAARQAVLDAMNEAGNFDEARPEPLESMGAVEFPSPEQATDSNTEDPSGAPPDAPPPFMPPFPTYDPNQDTNQQ